MKKSQKEKVKNIKIGFPNKNVFGFKIGWKDLGIVGYVYEKSLSGLYTKGHAFCGNRLRIGEENTSHFLYCPVCLIKIKE